MSNFLLFLFKIFNDLWEKVFLFTWYLEDLWAKIFPRYYVGFFVLSVPKKDLKKILSLINYCSIEEVGHTEFFKRYSFLLSKSVKDSDKYILDKFYRRTEEAATWLYDKYFALISLDQLKDEAFNKIQTYPYSSKGEILVYTLVITKDIKIKRINSSEKLDLLLKKLNDNKSQDSGILYYSIRFQGSSDEETQKIADQLSFLDN